MTIHWIKCCDDLFPNLKAIHEAFEKADFTPTKPISHCPYCGHPITVAGEPDTPMLIGKIIATDPKALFTRKPRESQK